MSYSSVPNESQESVADQQAPPSGMPPAYQQDVSSSGNQQLEQKSPLPPPYQPQQPMMMQYQGMPMGVVPGGMITARPPMLPRDMQPNDFMIISVVMILTLGIFNITSMFFTVPALICSVLAYDKRHMGKYTSARRLGIAAIVMNLLGLTWVMICGVVVTGVSVAYNYGVGTFNRI